METKVISVKIEVDKALQELVRLKGEAVLLKETLKGKDNEVSIDVEKSRQELGKLQIQIKQLEREIRNALIIEPEIGNIDNASIRQLESYLTSLREAHNLLDRKDREGALGQEYRDAIASVSAVISANERLLSSIGRTNETISSLNLDVVQPESAQRLGEITQAYVTANAEAQRLRQTLSDLNQAEGADATTLSAVAAELGQAEAKTRAFAAQKRILVDETKNEILKNEAEEGSLRALRAEVSRLTSQYDSMSRVRREGAEGAALLEQIQKVGKELNLAEQASLRFQRNVGNYQSAFGNLHFQVQQLARELPSLSYGFNVFIGAISNNLPMLVDEVVRARREYAEMMKTDPSKAVPVWRQLFSAVFNWQTALVAGITILTLYSRQIGDWISSLFKGKKALSDIYETTEEFHKAVGCGSGSMLADLEKLSVEWEKLGDNLESKQKFIKDNAKEFEKLGVSITSVEEAENALIKNQTAFENSLIARAKAAAAMKLAAEEYEKAVQKMVEAEAMPDTKTVWQATTQSIAGGAQGQFVTMENVEKKETIAESNALFASGDSLIKKAAGYSTEEAKILEEAGIKAKKANADKVKDAADTATKLRDMKAIELEEYRKAEDELLKLVQDARAREYKEMELSYGRQIEDLKARLETEKDLSVEARQAINDQISALEQQRANKRRELSAEALRAEIEATQAEIELKLEAVKEGTEAEYLLKLEALEKQKELDLTNTELTEEQKLLISQKYAKMRQDLESEQTAEINRRQAEAMKARFEKELAELQSIQSKKLENIIASGANEEQVEQAKLASEMEMLEMQHSQYLEEYANMKQQEGETDEQFAARRAEVQANADEAQMQATEIKAQMMANAYRSVVDGIEELGEVSESFAALSKVLALAEIAYNTGKALAAGIASAAAQPFPANIAAIATTVGTILANIAQATKIVNSFSKSSKGSSSSSAKFATGGLVEGEGTATSDSIPAMLSNGESVMTAAATSMFAPVLSAFNQIGGGVPIQATETANSVAGEEMLARAFMRGAASLPNPVVSVVDINAGQTRVAQVETLANL